MKIAKIRVVQSNPNTCVVVTMVNGDDFVGFSKAYEPDGFSKELGLHVALGKAVADAFNVQPPKSCDGPVRSVGVARGSDRQEKRVEVNVCEDTAEVNRRLRELVFTKHLKSWLT